MGGIHRGVGPLYIYIYIIYSCIHTYIHIYMEQAQAMEDKWTIEVELGGEAETGARVHKFVTSLLVYQALTY